MENAGIGRRMEADRISLALARIDAATARIEGFSRTPHIDGDLQQRHDRLRAETSAALAELDQLIGAIAP